MPESPPPSHDKKPLLAARVLVVGMLLYLWSLASWLPHNLDEVHGYNSYVRFSIDLPSILTQFPEPGHHVVHNLLLRYLYPILEGSWIQLRWPVVIYGAFTCWMAYRWGQQSSFTGRPDRTHEWSRVPLVLIPMSFAFFAFYACQSRGYMIGATCFLGFFILSQKLAEPRKWGFNPWAGLFMGLLGGLSIGAVLSNGTYVVGACVGFGLIDLFRRQWRVFVVRVLFMVGGAVFLASWHPAFRHLEKLEEFNHLFGLRFEHAPRLTEVVSDLSADVLSPMPLVFVCLSGLGLLVWVVRKNLLWIPVLTIAMTVCGAVWWGQNYQFSRSYMTATILAILLVHGALEGVLVGLERFRRPTLVWVTSAIFMGLGAVGWVAQAEGVQKQYAQWVFGIDNREWHEQSAPYSIELLPWDIYQGYYFDYPDVETKINKMFDSRRIGQIQMLSFEGTRPSLPGSPGLSDTVVPILSHGQRIGTTGRERWTISDVQYMGEWGSTPPEPITEGCDTCFVLLMFRAKMWFYPEFGNLPVSGMYFNRPYSMEEMRDGGLVFAVVVTDPRAVPEAIRMLQSSDTYLGPTRAFVAVF